MPKPHTHPPLYDEVLQLQISKLSQWSYLKENNVKRGEISWSSSNSYGKENRGKITVLVNMNNEISHIELDYNYKDEPRNYKIKLVSIPSNLGTGKIWYFLCPITKERCRKLYLIEGYFLHRKAFKGCMYESQIQTKKWRKMEKLYGCYFDLDNLYAKLFKKGFKKTYKGKPTKKYLKLMKKIRQAERIPIEEIERLMIMGV